jgi:uncharacterized protein YuzE
MKLVYDRDVDILTVILNEMPVEESDEVKEGIILDYDTNGNLVAMEILDASRLIAQPASVEFQLAK